MNTPLPYIDYTARDFDSIKEAMVRYLEQRFPDEFTDFTESQLGIAMLELFAYQGAILSYMLDRQVNEVYLDTARERESIIRLAALLGYKLSSATAASITIDLDTQSLSKYSAPVVIAAGTKIKVADLTFETDQQYTIQRQGSAGSYYYLVNGVNQGPAPLIGAREGETIRDTFTATGDKFLQLQCSRYPLIEGSLSATVGGVDWLAVTSLVLGNPDDSEDEDVFEVLLDKDDRPSLRFGDGVSGNVPGDGVEIEVTYRIGGGSVGNIAESVIGSIPATTSGTAITIRGFNRVGSGGADRESADHARLFAPQYARTTDRAVTYRDYFALTNGYSDGQNGSIAKAGIIADPTDGISNIVTVYAWSENAAGDLVAPGSPLKESLRQFLEERRTLGVWIAPVQDGQNVAIDIEALVRIDSSFDDEEIAANIEAALAELFRSYRVRYGNELRVSWLYDTIQDVTGVTWVHIETPNPMVETGISRVILSGILPAQGTPLPLTNDQVRLPPDARAADYWCNYRITVGTQTKRIIDYVPAAGGFGGVATVDSGWSPGVVGGQGFILNHPRKIRLAASASSTPSDLLQRGLILDPSGRAESRFIIAYDGVEKIATVNKNWVTAPSVETYKISRDFQASERQALVPGTITIKVLDG